MLNLLGDLWFDGDGDAARAGWDRVLALPGRAPAPVRQGRARGRGRKMGHVTVRRADAAKQAQAQLQRAAVLGIAA